MDLAGAAAEDLRLVHWTGRLERRGGGAEDCGKVNYNGKVVSGGVTPDKGSPNENAPLQTLPVPLRDTYDIRWSLDTR